MRNLICKAVVLFLVCVSVFSPAWAGKTLAIDLLVKGDAVLYCPDSWKVDSRSEAPYYDHEGSLKVQGKTISISSSEMYLSCFAGAAHNWSCSSKECAKLSAELVSKWRQYVKSWGIPGDPSPKITEKACSIKRLNGSTYSAKRYTTVVDTPEGKWKCCLVVAEGVKNSYENGTPQDGDVTYPVYFVQVEGYENLWKTKQTDVEKVLASFQVP